MEMGDWLGVTYCVSWSLANVKRLSQSEALPSSIYKRASAAQEDQEDCLGKEEKVGTSLLHTQ
jgi:hypothetical protein